MNPIASFRRKLQMDTGGVAVFALVVLAMLYFFDEFDTAAFGVLAPNIEKSFHLTDQKFVGLVTINVSLVILFAIPVGYLSDRVRRTPLVVASGILAGVFSFATGIVGTVWLLTLVRFGNGLGLLANGPVHRSLPGLRRPHQRHADRRHHRTGRRRWNGESLRLARCVHDPDRPDLDHHSGGGGQAEGAGPGRDGRP
jgi:hypothetical protein